MTPVNRHLADIHCGVSFACSLWGLLRRDPRYITYILKIIVGYQFRIVGSNAISVLVFITRVDQFCFYSFLLILRFYSNQTTYYWPPMVEWNFLYKRPRKGVSNNSAA